MLFDSVIDYITGIDASDVFSAVGAGATTLMGGQSRSTDGLLNELNRGVQRMSAEQSYSAKTPNGAPASVSVEALESQWLSRLNKFGSFQSDTMVKAR